MNLKEQILQLRSEGKSYRQIEKILKCSKGTVSYHCGIGQKEKLRQRVANLRKTQHPFIRKLENFKLVKKRNLKKVGTRKDLFLLRYKITRFHRGTKVQDQTFTVEDVINKFGENPTCYLTGDPIDINKPRTYHFDHIIPVSRGGTNTLDNLALTTKEANLAKCNMTPDEFVFFCKKVLEKHGYIVNKSSDA